MVVVVSPGGPVVQPPGPGDPPLVIRLTEGLRLAWLLLSRLLAPGT